MSGHNAQFMGYAQAGKDIGCRLHDLEIRSAAHHDPNPGQGHRIVALRALDRHALSRRDGHQTAISPDI